jgi:hypothetical protein
MKWKVVKRKLKALSFSREKTSIFEAALLKLTLKQLQICKWAASTTEFILLWTFMEYGYEF